ncbi:TPA: LysR family transcriptional regulator [Pseudomonas aeruginosa]|uniref:LysR family transcriptional regulator n=1 Tax=Pseudomonas TaxID=286 RepID=UPI0002A1F28D|nr:MULTISPECIES: LysR family transcriptional regulator [Pseudomonas]MBB1605405.1 hypothetical protein [Pseudomonas sp. UMC76]MBB1641350.1 hypothetical protein [Pseudomonas sp. UME83]MBF3004590.1 LysR family transcriptional regulator [Pseudomonas aeruginosa]MBF3194884.1 LysR family transcriptional regulator [Pseudomonas aeruginosa]MBF3213396.1 LysR family transcriptional regulator [Pseudomonas aeruginosa]
MANLDLNLNLLATLDVLLSEGSVNRTAARFGVSQAAISVQLAKLRGHFGDEIFVPRGRRLVTTPFAETLREPVRELIEQARQVIGLRQGFDPATTERDFHVHAGDIDAILLLSHVIRGLHSVAPNIRLYIHGSVAAPSMIDFFIRPVGLHTPEFSSCVLYTDLYCVLADAGHPALADSVSAPDYFAASHIVRHAGHTGAPSFEAATMARLGHTRKVGQVVDHYGSIPPMLVGTRYLTTVPTYFARQMAESFPLKFVSLPFEFPGQTILLQWHPHLAGDMAANWLRTFMVESAIELYASESAGELFVG